MNKSMHLLLYISSLLLCLCVLYACIGDEFVEDTSTALASDPEQIELVFTITTNRSYTATRATANDTTWGEAENLVAAEEAEYNIASMQVILFKKNTDGSYSYLSDVAQSTLASSVDATSNQCTYTYVGILSSDAISTGENFDGRIVILANCSIETSSFTSSTTYTDQAIREAVYEMTKTNNQIDISESGIPMWGTSSGSWTFYKGRVTDIGSVSLLRAMAKIKVALGSDMQSDGYRITGARLVGFSDNQGYIHPTGYATVDKTESLTIADSTFHPYTSNATQDSLYFFTAEDSSYAYIYVPEYDNPESNAAYIHLDLSRYAWSDGTYAATGTGLEKIELKTYSNGTATNQVLDLLRNYIYNFECYREAVSDSVFVTTTVGDWEAVETSSSWSNDSAVVYLLPSYYWFAYSSGDYKDTVYSDQIASVVDTLSFVKSSGSTSADAEAVYSMVMYPKWNSTSTSKLTYSYTDKDGTAYSVTVANTDSVSKYENAFNDYSAIAVASYLLFVDAPEGTGSFRWTAHLTNAGEYGFKLCTGTANINSTTNYYSTTGVSRSLPYELGVSLTGKTTDDGYKFSWDELSADYCRVRDGGESLYGFDYDSFALTATQADTTALIALYTDLFITIDGTDKPSLLTINQYNTTYDVSSYYKDTWYPGGTYEQEVTVDGETYTLGFMQWIRIYWFEARLYTNYQQALQRISEASEDKDKWY